MSVLKCAAFFLFVDPDVTFQMATAVRLAAKEVLWREAADEVEAAREMMASIANTLKGQGADGVPPPVDKSWETYGALGALQKCMAVCAR